jgi:hypothetical protein
MSVTLGNQEVKVEDWGPWPALTKMLDPNFKKILNAKGLVV